MVDMLSVTLNCPQVPPKHLGPSPGIPGGGNRAGSLMYIRLHPQGKASYHSSNPRLQNGKLRQCRAVFWALSTTSHG